jgi:hypothetical protein
MEYCRVAEIIPNMMPKKQLINMAATESSMVAGTLQEHSVLNIQGFIESQVFPDFMQGFLSGPLSEQQFGRIAWRKAKHEKNNDRYSQKGWNQ